MMPIAELIEIVPLKEPAAAVITVPGSKSITNRALVLSALAEGEITLRGALWSEDTQVMVEALQRLGFRIAIQNDPHEFCNRTLEIRGMGGKIPKGGTAEKPLELCVGNAGTAARFLAALVCLGRGVYQLQGTARMHERPQGALFEALRRLGYRIETPNDRLPARIFGAGPRRGACTVGIEESSQFASALLLCARPGGWTVSVGGESPEEIPYVMMTQRLIEAFPSGGGVFQVEADASSASYFWAANWLLAHPRQPPAGMLIEIAAVPKSNWQIDAAFPNFLPLPNEVSRRTELGDSIMTAIVLAPFATQPVRFTGLERLRVQECERVAALRSELAKCGATVREEGQTLTVYPAGGNLHGAQIQTYNDHRIAMCFAILGLKVPGIKIKNPACVKKTFPNFFQKLAARPPHGLGAQIIDAATRQPLRQEELFAD
jgi:3-phosphoshikimate 1-carboxyvinyltransferase